MQISPRYASDAPIQFEELPLDPVELMIGQRERMSTLLADLTPEQWAVESRCDGWSIQDVITHLTSTNTFWNFSLAAGLGGTPTAALADFDPVSTPAAIVSATPELTTDETLAAFISSNQELATTARRVGDDLWTAVAEAPPGHIALGAVVLHALWDSLIHECDIAVPLGIEPEVTPDEIHGALAYAAALGPAFAWMIDHDRTGALEIRGTEPSIGLSVVLDGSVVVRPLTHDAAATPPGVGMMAGRSPELLEALSVRAPLGDLVDAEHRWMVEGLAAVFDRT